MASSRDGGVVDLGARLGSGLPDLRSYLAAGALGLQPALPRGAEVDFREDEIGFTPRWSRTRGRCCASG